MQDAIRSLAVRLLVAVVALLPVALKAAPPEWFLTRRYQSYNPESGIIGVGIGMSVADAVKAATADISSQIIVTVGATTESRTSSSEVGDKGVVRSQAENKIRTSTAGTLESVVTAVTAQDGKTFYALCFLDRSRFGEAMKIQIASRAELIDGRVASYKKFDADGDLIAGLKELWNAGLDRGALDSAEHKMVIVTGEKSKGITAPTGAELQKMATDAFRRISLKVLSGDNQTAPRGASLPKPVVIAATYKSLAGAEKPLVDAEIAFQVGGKLQQTIKSGADGKATFDAKALGEGKGSITAICKHAEDVRWLDRLDPLPKVDLVYTSTDVKSVKIGVKAAAEDGSPLPELQKRVSDQLDALGYSVSDGGEYLVILSVKKADAKQVKGVGGSQHVVKAALDLTVKASTGGKALASISIKAQGLSAVSEDDAFKTAIKNLKISDDELASAVQRALEKK